MSFPKSLPQIPEPLLIPQRNATDCGICVLAMALAQPYEQVMQQALEMKLYDLDEGLHGEEEFLSKAGMETLWLTPKTGYSTARLTQLLQDQPALITVPLKSNPDILHLVYWNGKTLLDPDVSTPYLSLSELRPQAILLLLGS